MTTKKAADKAPIKKSATKKIKLLGTPAQRAKAAARIASDPNMPYLLLYCTAEERRQYMWNSMTPEDSLRLLYKAGILTPTGRLSSKYK